MADFSSALPDIETECYTAALSPDRPFFALRLAFYAGTINQDTTF